MSPEAYNESVELHADSVYRFIFRSIGCKETSEDIVQDAYEKLWIYRSNVSTEKAKAFLFKTAYNKMIDYTRKNKRQFIMGEGMETACPEPNPDHYNGFNEILEKAVGLLPDYQRSVLLLRDYEGYSYREIGEITGLNESQVKVYIYRARLFLKNYFVSIENVY